MQTPKDKAAIQTRNKASLEARNHIHHWEDAHFPTWEVIKSHRELPVFL